MGKRKKKTEKLEKTLSRLEALVMLDERHKKNRLKKQKKKNGKNVGKKNISRARHLVTVTAREVYFFLQFLLDIGRVMAGATVVPLWVGFYNKLIKPLFVILPRKYHWGRAIIFYTVIYLGIFMLSPLWAKLYVYTDNKLHFDRWNKQWQKGKTEILPAFMGFNNFYTTRGLSELELKKYDKAIVVYDRAIALNPKDADSYLRRGLAKQALYKYKAAIEDYTKAIELQPRNDKLYYRRGLARERNHEPNGAIKDFNDALALNSDYEKNPTVYFYRGLAQFRLERYRLAIADYNRAVTLNPKDGEAYLNRGLAYAKLGQLTDAHQDINKAITLQPRRAFSYFIRANVLYNLGHYAEALVDYNKALSLDKSLVAAATNKKMAEDMLAEEVEEEKTGRETSKDNHINQHDNPDVR